MEVEQKIEPALTAEEWAAVLEDAEWATSGTGNMIYKICEFGSRAIFGREIDEEHAIAAIALHGKPYGFTWEHVDQMRMAANLYLDGPATEARTNYILADDLRRTADLIAALLPPREQAGR